MKCTKQLLFSIFLIIFFIWIGCVEAITVNSSRKTVVTGGAGFIGSHVVQELLRRGDTVILIDNLNDAYDRSLKQNNLDHVNASNSNNLLYTYMVDIRDRAAMEAIFEEHKPDKICHLAARAGVRLSMEIPEEYITTNIIGTLTIFELAHKYGINQVVYASSSSVYGNCGEGPFVENFDISHPVSTYAMTKCAGELLAYTYFHSYGINSIGLRFFTVYGPRGRVDMAPFIFMDSIYNNKIVRVFGDGNSVRDFTYIGDIVDGIIRSIDSQCSGCEVINLGRGEPIVLQDFINTIEDIVCKKSRLSYEPMPITDVLLTHANIDKARSLLGYSPRVSVKEGLEKMYKWYLNEYMPLMANKNHRVKEIHTSIDGD